MRSRPPRHRPGSTARAAISFPTSHTRSSSAHPYTAALLRSVPRVTGPLRRTLPAIAGSPPDLSRPLPGCPFAPRCERARAVCSAEAPPPHTAAPGHTTTCHFPLTAPPAAALPAPRTAPITAAHTAPPTTPETSA
ncbi:oligopeptide/dipeptide ABC transporter ATP-binding protein [Kitasatospora sp. NPDC096147]|uniref:oligopeptide/dipeptide ABC transporter ATP-binding protein n=1 Tax=Kitasatospora sp. NPDC096147 TaxID=3364093 RepID=UPI00380919B3